MDWSKLNQSLYAVTFIAQGERERARNCTLCLESYQLCALYSPTTKSFSTARRDKAPTESREQSRGKRLACFAWNQGERRFQSCKYRHMCVKCVGDHKIVQCSWLQGE